MKESIIKIINKTGRDNANVGNSPSAKHLQISEDVGKDFAKELLLSNEAVSALEDNKIYPHDLSWYPEGTLTCCFIPLDKLLKEGFNTGHGFIRSPKSIGTAATLACIMLQSNQNTQHGGQAFGFFDRDLAPYVTISFERNLKELKKLFEDIGVEVNSDTLKTKAWEKTERETFQAMEAVVHNLNTMHARAGAQVPFTSVNIGTDTSKEGRLVCKCLLEAYKKGLGKGEQPLFPNIIFKIRKGINWEEESPNHDLLMLSLKVTAERLFPNYVFEDCTLNKDYPEDVPVMGCRTRVGDDRFQDKSSLTTTGRGNCSFTSLNLPGIALETKSQESDKIGFEELEAAYDINIDFVEDEEYEFFDEKLIKSFFVNLNDYADIVIRQLIERFKYQSSFTRADFEFLMDGVWMDSETLSKEDNLTSVIKHGSLALGFCGLAECLYALTGCHHGEFKEVNDLGIQIVKFLRSKCDEALNLYDLNFGLLATPAESLAGKFLEADRKLYGIIKGVTDKDWYTNSFHVPVEFSIDIFKKIEIEGQYHKYCNGGQISYVELDASPKNNPEALLSILKAMEMADMGYVAINFPIDRCECGHFGLINGDCPVCGNASKNISRIRRITGYLAEIDMFNHAKSEEAKHRTPHMKLKI